MIAWDMPVGGEQFSSESEKRSKNKRGKGGNI